MSCSIIYNYTNTMMLLILYNIMLYDQYGSLSLYIYVCMYVCMYISISLSLYIYIYIFSK